MYSTKIDSSESLDKSASASFPRVGTGAKPSINDRAECYCAEGGSDAAAVRSCNGLAVVVDALGCADRFASDVDARGFSAVVAKDIDGRCFVDGFAGVNARCCTVEITGAVEARCLIGEVDDGDVDARRLAEAVAVEVDNRC